MPDDRIAVIDIGTNSILLLIAERMDGDTVSILCQQSKTARLGQGLHATQQIGETGLSRAVTVIQEYQILAGQYNVHRITAVGTRVFRSAGNSDAVRRHIRKAAGLDIEILSETDEARWSFAGAVHQRPLTTGVMVVDIGGGSTELVTGTPEYISRTESLPAGAVVLTEQHIRHDPPSREEWNNLDSHIREMVAAYPGRYPEEGTGLIGVGGTITTLAAMDLKCREYRPERIDGHSLSHQRVRMFTDQLRRTGTVQTKMNIPFDPQRADILPAGAALLNRIMEAGRFRKIITSDRGLRFGIALRELTNNALIS